MTKFTQFALAGAVMLIGATSAIAASNDRNGSARVVKSQSLSNEADPYGGHSPNSPQGNRAFWDYHGRHGN